MSGHRPRETQGWTTGATIMQLLSNCCHTGVQSVRACMQSCFSQLFQLCESQWTAAHQIPLSMRFSRQEYWSWLPSPPPGDLPDPGIKSSSLMSPTLAGGFFTTSATWEAPNQYSMASNASRDAEIQNLFKCEISLFLSVGNYFKNQISHWTKESDFNPLL